jgi:hypothetical protein
MNALVLDSIGLPSSGIRDIALVLGAGERWHLGGVAKRSHDA